MIGAPCSTAATPPMTMKSTSAAASARRIRSAAMALNGAGQMCDGSHPALHVPQPLHGSEVQEPADLRQVDAIRGVGGGVGFLEGDLRIPTRLVAHASILATAHGPSSP